MRTPLFLPAFLALALSAYAEVSPISLRVEQTSGNASDRARHVQTRSLKVYLTNSSTNDITGLKVKYFYFATDLKDKDVSVIDKGERTADVKSHLTQEVELPEVKATYSDEHGQRTDGRGGKGLRSLSVRQNNVHYKSVEASGTKLTGYAVQVFSGNKLMVESYSEPSLKERAK